MHGLQIKLTSGVTAGGKCFVSPNGSCLLAPTNGSLAFGAKPLVNESSPKPSPKPAAVLCTFSSNAVAKLSDLNSFDALPSNPLDLSLNGSGA